MFEAKIPLPELKDDADLGGAPAWASRTIGRPPACESPKEPCLYCDLPAPQARMEMRLRSGLTCGQLAGRRRTRRSSRARPQVCRVRPRQALRKPHLACALARSTNTVSSGSDVSAPAHAGLGSAVSLEPAGPCQRHSRFTQSTTPSAAAASRARLSFGYQ